MGAIDPDASHFQGTPHLFILTTPRIDSLFAQIGSSAKPTIPSDISADAQDFLLKTFDLDYVARPDAGELLQHSWIAMKKPQPSNKGNTLKAPPTIEITA
jgi:serine/threonine protein kinase